MRLRLPSLLLLSLTLLVGSCSTYHKATKSDNPQFRYDVAKKMYERGDYNRALPLLESLLLWSRGRPEHKEISWMHANSNYKEKFHMVAAYQFKQFAESYADDSRAEEAYYLYAWNLYKQSPPSNLDQRPTVEAIQAFVLFTNKYAHSSRVADCNRMIDELTAKLEEKAINNTLLYYRMEDYKSAAWAVKELIEEYPGTARREELELIYVKSLYYLAQQSVDRLRPSRLEDVVEAADDFKARFPNSQYVKEAQRIGNDAQSAIAAIKNTN